LQGSSHNELCFLTLRLALENLVFNLLRVELELESPFIESPFYDRKAK